MKQFLFITFLFISVIGFSQKKVIDPSVYNDWKSLSSSTISNDGLIITYEIKPHRGDGYLYIYHVESKKLDSIYRATDAKISGNGSYVAFKINPGYDTLRTCELKKIDKKKWPKDSLGIYFTHNDSIVKYEKIKSFHLNDEDDWGVFVFDHNELKSTKKKKHVCKKKQPKELESNGNYVLVFHPEKGKKELKDISDFDTNEKANIIAFVTHQKDKSDSMGISILNLSDFSSFDLSPRKSSIEKMVFNEAGSQLAYLVSNDTSKVKNYNLNMLNLHTRFESVIIDTIALDAGNLSVSTNYQPGFSKEGNRLYFGVAERLKEEPKDTLLESEKVELDLWHYQDKRLQPQQLIEKKRDEKATSLYVYHLNGGEIARLSNDTLETRAPEHEKGEFIVGVSRERYMASDNWNSPWASDYYLVNMKDGSAKLVEEGALFGINLSPTGNKYVLFNNEDQQYYSIENVNEDQFEETCLTCDANNITWTDDVNGMPMDAYPYGVIGWSEDENKVFLQGRYDIWYYNYQSKELSALTDGIGQENKIEMRPHFWSDDSVYFYAINTYIDGFDTKTKGTHLYDLSDHDDHYDIRETAYFDADIVQLTASKTRTQFLMRKMTFEEYPELFTYGNETNTYTKISTTNPQQSDYNWGTVELVKWKSYNGIELEGLLYRPEDFDPNKKYPLMVYFYELYSDRYHQHYIPKPTASIIYATEYASAGYVVFMPDIRYTPGHPAKSAYDCIMSGTDHVLEILPNVDSTRMALQGQSWGGYQTAQLITMTNRYRAAMAGAPVSNMFSAYGGIRWGSGLNRQFQYERTQSRIGATIWEKPELYIENSPIFHIPNITTPLLIMHNDKDGAVPWYQGIEMFTAMKRLGKAAWLLNYNGDDHNLMENANRMDLSIRMRQFFDHYLKDEPAPRWLVEGIPAVDKGIDLKYDIEE